MPHSTLPPGFKVNAGVPVALIREAEARLDVTLPAEYVGFLHDTNGGEGPIGATSYVVLWPVEQLAIHNEGYKVDTEYAPDLTLIGTDGGNEVFAIRRTDDHFVRAPLIGMEPDLVVDLGATLDDFFNNLP